MSLLWYIANLVSLNTFEVQVANEPFILEPKEEPLYDLSMSADTEEKVKCKY